MAEKFGPRSERELKIGQSFTNPKSAAFHTLKYDFKPASVDTNKKATVDVAGNNQVTVTVPHLDGAGVPQTVFKGSQRPYQKECVLIIDRVTGEITLEKLGCNIQVKKTRSEYNKVHLPNADRLNQSASDGVANKLSPLLSQRSQTPPTVVGVGQRVSYKTKVTTSGRQRKSISAPPQQQQHLVPKHSPMHASPSYQQRSPMHPTKSPKRDPGTFGASSHSAVNNTESLSQSTLASLPMIGIDDFTDVAPSQSSFSSSQTSLSVGGGSNRDKNSNAASDGENRVGEITDSSSSSDSDSDEDNTTLTNKSSAPSANRTANGYSNGPVDTQILNDDLCLSESGSDSD